MDNKISQFVFEKMGVPAYRTYLNLAAFKQKLVSGNIANVSTPGYEAKQMDFQKEFEQAADKGSGIAGAVTNERHIPLGRHPEKPPRVYTSRVEGSQLNSVDIDKEVTSMAQNELRFTIAARVLKNKFDGMRKAITSK